ncbi:hypothetical protein ROS9278_02453 [Roseomonas sp. CECT 9278]|nr:hypothetical protein ROS9278_02453 [Roseomonas sp. CECT 9278]
MAAALTPWQAQTSGEGGGPPGRPPASSAARSAAPSGAAPSIKATSQARGGSTASGPSTTAPTNRPSRSAAARNTPAASSCNTCQAASGGATRARSCAKAAAAVPPPASSCRQPPSNGIAAHHGAMSVGSRSADSTKACQVAAKGTTWIAAFLSSGWKEIGSACGATSTFTRAAGANCAVQCIGAKAVPRRWPSSIARRNAARPRGERASTSVPGSRPSASDGFSVSSGSGAWAISRGSVPVRVMLCHWSRNRPVSRRNGKSGQTSSTGARKGVGTRRARGASVPPSAKKRSGALPCAGTGQRVGGSVS